MKKVLTSLFCGLTSAYHPFVGEHADATSINGDGRVTSKMKPVKAAYNKHAKHLTKQGLFEEQKYLADHIQEMIWGPVEDSPVVA